MKIKQGENLRDEIRLMRQYNYNKLKHLEKLLEMLIDFSRDDLKRLDRLEKLWDKGQKDGSL